MLFLFRSIVILFVPKGLVKGCFHSMFLCVVSDFFIVIPLSEIQVMVFFFFFSFFFYKRLWFSY